MNVNRDLERQVTDYYATEAPPRAPDWVLRSALTTIDTTPQRRALIRVPWRYQSMNSFAKLAVAAVAVIAVGAVGLSVLRPAPTPGAGGVPLPSPSATSSLSPTPPPSDLLPALTETFTSALHGISVSHPAGWTVRQATEPWTTGILSQESASADVIYASAVDSPFIALASQALGGKTDDLWAADLSTHADWGNTCVPPTEAVTIDGHPGVLVHHCPDGAVSALVAVQDRGYLILGYRLPSSESFMEILATVRLDPASAIDARPSVSPTRG